MPYRCFSELSVGFFPIGTPEEIIHADAVEIRQGTQNVRRNHPLAAFIVGVAALRDIDCSADFLLR